MAKGLSQNDVCRIAKLKYPEVAGFQRSSLASWELGDKGRSPNDVQLIAWAGALDCQILIHPVGSAPVAITYDAAACRGAA